jgi:hypothetical protein
MYVSDSDTDSNHDSDRQVQYTEPRVEDVQGYVSGHLSLRELVTHNECQSAECIAFKVLAHKSNRRQYLWQMVLMQRSGRSVRPVCR